MSLHEAYLVRCCVLCHMIVRLAAYRDMHKFHKGI